MKVVVDVRLLSFDLIQLGLMEAHVVEDELSYASVIILV